MRAGLWHIRRGADVVDILREAVDVSAKVLFEARGRFLLAFPPLGLPSGVKRYHLRGVTTTVAAENRTLGHAVALLQLLVDLAEASGAVGRSRAPF